MPLDPQHPILALARRKGVLRTRDVSAAGESRVTLAQLVRGGTLSKLGRGLYALPDRPLSEHGALAEVAAKSSQGVVCQMLLHKTPPRCSNGSPFCARSNCKRPH